VFLQIEHLVLVGIVGLVLHRVEIMLNRVHTMEIDIARIKGALGLE